MACHFDCLNCCREAWHTLGSMSVMEAIVKYIELVKTLDPQWKNSGVESGVG